MRINPARYAKSQMAVHPERDGSGYKTREARLAEAVGGRWSHREEAYIMSPRKAANLARFADLDWDASIFGLLRLPGGSSPDFTYQQAVKLL